MSAIAGKWLVAGFVAVSAAAIVAYQSGFFDQPVGPVVEPEIVQAQPAAEPVAEVVHEQPELTEPEVSAQPLVENVTAVETGVEPVAPVDPSGQAIATPVQTPFPEDEDAEVQQQPVQPVSAETPIPEPDNQPVVQVEAPAIDLEVPEATESDQQPVTQADAPVIDLAVPDAKEPSLPEVAPQALSLAGEGASIGQPPGIQAPAAIEIGGGALPAIAVPSGAPVLGLVATPAVAPDSGIATASFDLVRIDPQGNTLVAGRAEPNAFINITSGDEVLGRAQADESGQFVAFLNTPVGESQNLRLEAGMKETNVVASQDEIIILPVQQDDQQAAPVVVLATQDTVQVIQPSGLSVPDNISLDTISYNETGDVVLAGRGQPHHLARVYADQQVVGEVQISDSGGWSMTVTGIDAGRYVLRVDEISNNDRVSSRVESPFQREFPEAEAMEGFAQGARIIVQPGNTLWLMAMQAYGDGDNYTQIFTANREAIRDPNLIYPGQVISIPMINE